MNNLPDMFTDTFPDYLITTIVMFNNRPCSDLITQAAKDEYDDETRGCASIGRRAVFTYRGRNVKKGEYQYNETVVSCCLHRRFENVPITDQGLKFCCSQMHIYLQIQNK